MNTKNEALPPFSSSLSLKQRVDLVVAVYENLGYINRKALMNAYSLTQIQASALMRDFISKHAINLKWDKKKSHYTLNN